VAFTTRHLRAVPDAPSTVTQLFENTLGWLHRKNGAIALQREAKHFIREAEKAGNEEQAQAFREAYEAASRARELARP
jgi:hypothetical protein